MIALEKHSKGLLLLIVCPGKKDLLVSSSGHRWTSVLYLLVLILLLNRDPFTVQIKPPLALVLYWYCKRQSEHIPLVCSQLIRYKLKNNLERHDQLITRMLGSFKLIFPCTKWSYQIIRQFLLIISLCIKAMHQRNF